MGKNQKYCRGASTIIPLFNGIKNKFPRGRRGANKNQGGKCPLFPKWNPAHTRMHHSTYDFIVPLGHTNLMSCCRRPTDSNFAQLRLKMKITCLMHVITCWPRGDMASSSVTWPSLVVKRGPFVVGGRKIVKVEWSKHLASYLCTVQDWIVHACIFR